MAKAKARKVQTEIRKPQDQARAWREGVESIVIAIVLAFLFRAFEAEAFVIPTGSMAPTLQGRHKDVRCPQCGYRYQAGATADVDVQLGEVEAVTCPMCHFDQELDKRRAGHASNAGDRILVNKFAYETPFGEPQRWDVIVFKYPGNAKQNYIKRCIGLPNEIVKIHHGDIYVKKTDEKGMPSNEDFQIARKPPRKLVHMLQPVHDTRYLSSELQQVGWPLNWQPREGSDGWSSPDQGRTYHGRGGDETEWLSFRQYLLDHSLWEQIGLNRENNVSPLERVQQIPVPVTDFYAYNAQTRFDPRGHYFDHPVPIGMHWVGDLALNADMDVISDSGQLEVMLVEAGRQHVCQIDLATGRATLRIDDGKVPFSDSADGISEQPAAETPIRGAGRYAIRFANVDDQLLLWINDKLCEFDRPTTYGPTLSDRPESAPTDPGDMHPVRLGVRQGEIKTRRLQVLRDIYYIATSTELRTATDYKSFDEGQPVVEHLISPQRWHKGDLFDRRTSVEFVMKQDQFFPLGDNSPYSKDGRLWDEDHFVERDMLIGKAVLIYWPHAWRVGIPGTGISRPLIPNFQNMGLIH
jgi:signal peptidase I